MKNISLERVLSSLPPQPFIAEAEALVAAEEARLKALIDSYDVSTPIPLLDILSGMIPARIFFDLLVKKVTDLVDAPNPSEYASYIVSLLVSKAFTKVSASPLPVYKAPFANSLPYIDAILNCGIFNAVTRPDVFNFVLSEFGYMVDLGGTNDETH